MKKLVLFVFGSLVMLANATAQCAIDTTFKTPGIYPVNGTSTGFSVDMPDGYANVYYSEIIQIRTPTDTIVDTLGIQIPATVDSLRILSFSGLPSSLSYSCNNSRCVWVGGSNGCATFYGTPTLADVGMHNIDIMVLGTVGLGVFGQISDTLVFKMTLEIKASQSIGEQALGGNFSLQPNPMTSEATLLFDADAAKNYNLYIVDVAGRTVQHHAGQTVAGKNEIKLMRKDLPRGIYFYNLSIDGATKAGRIVVAD